MVAALLAFEHWQFSTFVQNQHGAHWQGPRGYQQKLTQNMIESSFTFDFAAIETLLWQLEMDKHGVPQLSSNSVPLLDQISRLLPEEPTVPARTRLNQLMSMALTGENSQSGTKLVWQYHALQSALANAKQQGKLTPLHKKQLREQFLGETWSDQLFGRQHALADYLKKRKQIQADSTLTVDQTRSRLKALEQQYRQRHLAPAGTQ